MKRSTVQLHILLTFTSADESCMTVSQIGMNKALTIFAIFILLRAFDC